MTSLKKLKYRMLAFVVLFIMSLSFISLHSTGTPYDAGYYWTIADPVFSNGFQLLNFPETFRGYFFPVLLSGFKLLFPELAGWNILSSLMIALLISYILPSLFDKSIDGPRELILSTIAGIVVIYFWGGLASFPLSDLPAAFFMCAGALLCKSAIKTENEFKGILCGFLGGGACYAAYNVRATFLYGIIILMIGMSILFRKRWRSLLLTFVAGLLGMWLIAVPQCMINQQYVGTFSPKVYTEQLYGYQQSLQNQQVLWGINMPRYETYVGDSSGYPEAGIRFIDPIGSEIIQREGITAENFSYLTFFKLWLKYPLDMLGIYTKHLLSALTICWASPYIQNIHASKEIIISLSIILWLLSGLALLTRLRKKEWNFEVFIYSVAVAVPGFLQILGAVEVRFLLPFFLLMYTYTFQIVDWKEVLAATKGHRLILGIILFIIYIFWITVIGGILGEAAELPVLIHG